MTDFFHHTSDTFNSDFSTAIYNSTSSSTNSQHFHKNFEIIAVCKGELHCSVGDRKYTLSEGQAIFICPFQLHGFSLGAASEIRRITFHEHLILTVYRSLENRVPKNPVFYLSPDLFEFTMTRLSAFWGNESVTLSRITPYETRVQIKGILYLLCGEFLQSTELTELNRSSKIAIAVVEYISKNFQKNISLSEVAKQQGYNTQYISRVFNSTMGSSFKKMLNQFRLEHAYAMLQDTDLSISHICFESGFQSIRSFNQECKNAFGKTPKELRQSRTSSL